MCGIAGIYLYNEPGLDVDREELRRIRDHMAARGPDGCGEWFASNGRVGLGHRRLAIIDLSDRAAQPMVSADGKLVVTFNGEIYNYKALRQELEAKGYRFRTQSDTEVLLHLYAEKGKRMVSDLRGMYAFAIWDERRCGLFLARDPFGIKPLYYADNGRTIRFASQVKALLKGDEIDTTPGPAGHVGFYLWGHVPDPYTLYKGIRALHAGSSLWVDVAGHKEPARFFNAPDELAKASATHLTITREDMHERLRTALLDSVRHHMVADVPVGVFLSAGLDSATLVALAKEAGINDLRTVTLGFKEFVGTHNDETALAQQVAQHYGAQHQTQWVQKEDFAQNIGHLLAAMDQPSIDGINSYFVCKAAKEAGLKVVLSGLGGDELFGGYSDAQVIPRMVKAFGCFQAIPSQGKGFRILSAPILKHFTSPKYAGLLEYGGTYGGAYLLRRSLYMPWELPDLLDGEMVRQGWNELQPLRHLKQTTQGIDNVHLKVTALETAWYMRNQLLRDTDWASMAHSLEVRVPLVDTELFRAVAPLLSSTSAPGKLAMASAPQLSLPSQILKRRKTGFSIPVSKWIVQDHGAETIERGLREWATRIYREWEGDKVSDSGGEPPTLLIFRYGQLGDTLVAMPAIEAIRRQYPDHRLVLLTNRHAAELGYVSSWDVLGPTGWFDRVMYYDINAIGRGSFGELFLLLADLRAMKPDHVFNLASRRSFLQGWRDKWYFSVLVGARNYHAPIPHRCHKRQPNRSLPRLEPEWHHLLCSVGGEESEDFEFRLPIPDHVRERALRVAQVEGIDFGTRLLAVGPGSKMPAKKWPAERFAELGTRLQREFPDLQLIVLGGKEDIAIGRELCDIWGEKAHNLAGKLTVYGSAVVLENCIAYVGNDAGTMHLAGMAGIPCVAIFSARDNPGTWEPYGKGHVVLRHDVSCGGCMLQVCEQYDNECLKLIGVDEVYAAMRHLIR